MNNIIGSRINAALALRNVKQKELAKEIGVKDNVISYWCNGSRIPNTEQIIQISNVLDVSTDYLLGKTKAKTSDKDIQFISDYTKLSELSITHIQSIQAMFDYEILNYLFECGAITDIVEVIYKALKYADTYNPSQFQGEIITRINDEVIDYFDLLMGNNKVQKELDLSEFNATRILQNAIEQLYLNCGATDKSIQVNKIIKETKAAGGLDD